MKLLIIIFLEFFKTGMFAIGGGYAALPFLYQLSDTYKWFSPKDLVQMLAIANVVPGPIGINLASQIGFKVAHVLGALMAVAGILLPSIIFVFIISKLLKEFEDNKFVKSIFYMLKPTSCAMIAGIGVKFLQNTMIKTPHITSLASFDWAAIILFIALFILSLKKEFSALFYLAVSALAGVLIHIVKLFVLG